MYFIIRMTICCSLGLGYRLNSEKTVSQESREERDKISPDSAPFEGEKLWGEWLCIPEASVEMGGAGPL